MYDSFKEGNIAGKGMEGGGYSFSRQLCSHLVRPVNSGKTIVNRNIDWIAFATKLNYSVRIQRGWGEGKMCAARLCRFALGRHVLERATTATTTTTVEARGGRNSEMVDGTGQAETGKH